MLHSHSMYYCWLVHKSCFKQIMSSLKIKGDALREVLGNRLALCTAADWDWCVNSLMWEPHKAKATLQIYNSCTKSRQWADHWINSRDYSAVDNIITDLRHANYQVEKWTIDGIASPIQIGQHMQIEIAEHQMSHWIPNTWSESWNIHLGLGLGELCSKNLLLCYAL